MKKVFIYVGAFFGILLIMGVIASMFDESYKISDMAPEKKVEYIKHLLWEKCSDTISMDSYFTQLDTIKKQGGVAAQLVDSVLLQKEEIVMSVKNRQMENYVRQAKKDIKSQFDKNYGYHIALTEAIKKQLNDPESFEHVETKYDIGSGFKYIIVYETFRFKNIYSGEETHTTIARFTPGGSFIEYLNN